MSDVVVGAGFDTFCASERVGKYVDRTPEARSRFSIDGRHPNVVVSPTGVLELQSVLNEAQKSEVALVPVGGGHQLALGNLPARYDAALSLAALDRVVSYEASDMVITVQSGMRLEALDATLRMQHQYLPLRPLSGAAGTVGGMLSANDQGMLRYAYGTARDWLIGLTVVQADGALVHSGGRVVKNVAGYDMGKLYVGALGSLGVIAEATFKVAPLPSAEADFAVAFPSPHAVGMFLLAARDESLAIIAAELLSPAAAEPIVGVARWCALVRVAGGAAVERSLRELRALVDGLQGENVSVDGGVTERWERTLATGALAFRCALLPSRVVDAVDQLAPDESGAIASATLGAGMLRLRYTGDAEPRALRTRVDQVRAVIADLGGSVVVERAPASLKEAIDVFGPPRADFPIMRRLKDALDPGRTLSPGRFMGRL